MVSRSSLEQLLAACTVRVDIGGSPNGTAFFVAPGRAVTAAHVVMGTPELEVDLVTEDGRVLSGRVAEVWPDNATRETPYPPPDLALILTSAHDHPCVLLGEHAPGNGTALKIRGYTLTLAAVARPETTLVDYGGELVQPGSEEVLYKLNHGEVADGMSGGPVLDLATGRVAGMVRTSRLPDSNMGGWAVPARQIRLLSAATAAAHDEFHLRDTRWQAAVRAAAEQPGRGSGGPAWWHDKPIRPFERLSGNRGRARYLVEEHLRYIPYHGDLAPDALLGKLGRPDLGVLLVSPPGAGKTRLCWEVGKLAVAEGWHVWYTRSPSTRRDASQLTVADLRTAVFGDGHELPVPRVLIILDYLDNHDKSLDFDELGQLIDDADAEGVHVALLATCRPGAQERLLSFGASTLLETRRLPESGAHRKEVIEAILTELAPNAVARWGFAEVRRRCGSRFATPAFTLLLAVAWERLAEQNDSLPVVSDTTALAQWLSSRLEADHVLNRGAGPHRLTDGDLLGYAIAAATCRRRAAELTTTVQTALSAFTGQPATGNHVDRLQEAGWLVRTEDDAADPELDVLHDSVADSLLRAVLFPNASADIDATNTKIMLDAASADATAFERFATHVSRLYVDLDSNGGRKVHAAALRRVCDEWLQSHRVALGNRLTRSGAAGEQAIYAVVHHRPWAELAADHLDDIAGPVQSGSLIVNTLRGVPGKHPVTKALIWLSRNKHGPEALSVLINLVRRNELQDRNLALQAAAYAQDWLDQHDGGAGTDRLLRALLTSRHLFVTESFEGFLQAARSALRVSPAEHAGHLLIALVGYGRLSGERDGEVTARAIDSIRLAPTHVSSGALLDQLLSGDVGPEEGAELVDLALAWLPAHYESPSAPYVLRSLLALDDAAVGAENDRKVVEHTLIWLARRLSDHGAVSVLLALLHRDRLTGRSAQRAAQQALRWAELPQQLGDHGVRNWPHNGYLIVAQALAIIREDRANAPHAAVRIFRHMPAQHPEALVVKDGPVLGALLRIDAKTTRRRLRPTALAWLAEFGDTREASRVLAGLLAGGDLGRTTCDRTMSAAIRWLERHNRAGSASWVINAALHQPDISVEYARITEELALAWLAEAEEPTAVRSVLRTMLSQGRLDESAARDVAARLFPRRDQRAEAHHLLGDLAREQGTTAEVTEAMLDWLNGHPDAYSSAYTFLSLLERDLDAEQLRTVTAHAVSWLDLHQDRANAASVLTAILLTGRLGRDAAPSTAVVGPALGWVRARPLAPRTGEVIAALLARQDITAPQRSGLGEDALRWLNEYPQLHAAGSLATTLLRNRAFAEKDRMQMVVDSAFTWLEEHPGENVTGVLIGALWGGADLRAGARLRLLRLALDWLDRRSGYRIAEVHLLAQPITVFRNITVPRELADRVVKHANDCLAQLDRSGEQTGERPGAPSHTKLSYVLSSALHLNLADPDLTRPIVRRALSWLERPEPEELHARVLEALLRNRHLTAGQLHSVCGRALGWLAGDADRPRTNFVIQQLLKLSGISHAYLIESAERATAWLADHLDDRGATYLFERLLFRSDLPVEILERALELAAAWLSENQPPRQVSHVYQSVLQCRALKGHAARRAIEQAIGWARRMRPEVASRLYEGLLSCPDTTAAEAGFAVRGSLAVLQGSPMMRYHSMLLQNMLDQIDRTPQHADEVFAVCRRWLAEFATEASLPFVSGRMLALPGLDPREREELTALTLAWLPDYPFRHSTPPALLSLIDHAELTAGQWDKVVLYGRAWLSAGERILELLPPAGMAEAAELAGKLQKSPTLDADSRAELQELRVRLLAKT